MDGSTPLSPPALARWLAVDTSTDRLSVAVGAAGATAPLAQHEGPGGPQASAALLPAIHAVLQAVGWSLASLDGIAFGRGPGSFTGLRIACAVVQGLAVAARPGGIPVLPIDTLLAVAEAARHDHAPDAPTVRVVAALDARMDEVYVASYDWQASAGWTNAMPPCLCTPENVPCEPEAPIPVVLAGNVRLAYGERLPAAWQHRGMPAHPSAAALLRLAAAGITAGQCVPAAAAQPLYVRDKVALTITEQAALRAQRTRP